MKSTHRFFGSEAELHELATKATGLTDFGVDYLPGLRVLLASIDADARLTEAGVKLVRDALLITLIARATTEKGWRDYPEYRRVTIARPIVITGIPRTGTTALHKLLAVDPQFQGLEHWLTTSPMPRPPRELWERDPRYAQAAAFLSGVYDSSPEFRAAHNIVVDEVDECIELLRQSFVSNRWACTWTSPGYDAWWQTQDELPSYRRYADIVRLIGCHDSQHRWLLKNPGHISQLGSLFEVFPDACVIQTHRDPVKAIASFCSTLFHLHRAFEGDGAATPALLLGPREMEKWALAVENARPAREKFAKQILDVNQADFHLNPIAVVQRIYDFCGLRMTAEVERAMTQRIGESPETRHGAHRYRAVDFGISDAAIADRFSKYSAEFGLR